MTRELGQDSHAYFGLVDDVLGGISESKLLIKNYAQYLDLCHSTVEEGEASAR